MTSRLWNVGDVLLYEGEQGLVIEVDNETHPHRHTQELLVEFEDGRREFIANVNPELEST